MATTMKSDPDGDTRVTYEDQQKINRFACFNAKLLEVKEELAAKKKELQNLMDAADELLMLDENEKIPYQIGEVFVSLSVDEANEQLEMAKEKTQEDIKTQELTMESHKKILQDLKVELYAKFGTNINLEAEED
ncbi:hypothetical protein CHS0354_033896 [Potamilus streckersoni]|uniref:Prefoldin subunit 4 n=1 Tax=Potamilus streckersoni TaxID=2493646 RepID=A0AAE0RX22_9BIVA|nr:hypothetical protein CHS0354_033896 [Potamilus streckersoni]